jgi:hypothetical protein
VITLGLPDSPIKPTEKRAKAWLDRWGRQQVEIDALAALQPDVLDQIAREAVAPYWDPTLDQRFEKATALSSEVDRWFRTLPEFRAAEKAIRAAHMPARKAVGKLNRAAAMQIQTMRKVVRDAADRSVLEPIKVQPEIEAPETAEPIFDSSEDFVAASLRLKRSKALAPDDDDETEGGDA